MSRNKCDTKNHVCKLPERKEDVVNYLIDAGILVNFRRTLQNLIVIHPKHPYTKIYAPSINRLQQEKKRQLINHKTMIHPLSMFTFGFNIFTASILYGTFLLSPILTPSWDDQIWLTQNFFAFKNIMQCAMILQNFMTGYYDISRNKVVLDRYGVILRYLSTYFIVDVAGIVPAIIRGIVQYGYMDGKNLVTNVIRPLMIFIMYGRYFYCIEVLYQVKLASGLSTFVYQAIKFLSHFVTFLLLMIFVLYYILHEIPDFSERAVSSTFEDVLTMLVLVDHGLGENHHLLEVCCSIICLLGGFILHLILCVEGMELYYRFSCTTKLQTTTFNSIEAYMRFKGLSVPLRERIWLYVDFKYQKHFYKEAAVYQLISAALYKETLIQTSLSTTSNVELFQKLPDRVLDNLRANLVTQIYLPGDTIARAGKLGKSMFFIWYGTVTVTTPNGKLVCYLRDGAHFGEISLVINTQRVVNVSAETPCELFEIRRQSFLEVINQYPYFKKELVDLATQYMGSIQKRVSRIDLRSLHVRRSSSEMPFKSGEE